MHQKAARAAADQQCRADSLRKSGWPLRLLRSFSSILTQPDGWKRQFIVLAHAWPAITHTTSNKPVMAIASSLNEHSREIRHRPWAIEGGAFEITCTHHTTVPS